MNLKKELFSVNWGLLALAMVIFGIFGYYHLTGIHPIFMAMITSIIGGLIYFSAHHFIALLHPYLHKIHQKYWLGILSFIVTICLARYMGMRFPVPAGFYIIGLLVISILLFQFSGTLKNQKYNKLSILGYAGSLLIATLSIYWLASEGTNPHDLDQKATPKISKLSDKGILSPSEIAKYELTSFTYGSNNDKHRPEFNQDAKYLTETVDASLILPEWKGKKKKWREQYWGFGLNEFPINGRVSMPQGEGPFPIVLIVHGNHNMIDYSDAGYEYLTNKLAAQGCIAISVDENFINGHWSGDFRGKEMPTRAWLLLKHLAQWRTWNQDPKHDLYKQADLSRIMLIGHSRGGEAVSIAAAFNKLTRFPDNALESFDFNFGIKGIVTLAPTDYRYERQISLENVNYLSLQGSYDADEISFWGMRPFNRLNFTDDGAWIKAGVYMHGANHGQFNETWGRKDFGGITGWFLNTKPLMTSAEQQQIAEVFISSFVQYVFFSNKNYLPMLQNVSLANDWLPDHILLTNYQDYNDEIILDFESDLLLDKGENDVEIKTNNLKIWREEILKSRDKGSQENSVAILGWDYRAMAKTDSIANYEILLDSSSVTLDSFNYILIDIASLGIKELNDRRKENDFEKIDLKNDSTLLDFSVAIMSKSGKLCSTKISDHKQIYKPLTSKITKLTSLNDDMIGDNSEVRLESFIIPLASFTKDLNRTEMMQIKSINLIFDQSQYGLVAIDNIGFSK